MTPPEIALWLALRRNPIGLRFRRQYPAGPYILDFYCAPARLAIEVDGEAHSRGNHPERDYARDTWLAGQNVHVSRYSATEVMSNLPGVVEQILLLGSERSRPSDGGSLSAPSVRRRLTPPPGGGGSR
jgi:very-short-patch-repair endonuclease